MRPTMLLVGLAILGTALVILVLRHDAGTVLGLDTDTFARLAQLGALALVIGSGVLLARGSFGANMRAALFWVALGALLVLGYAFRPEIETAAQRMIGVLVPGQSVAPSGDIAVTRRAGMPFMLDGLVDGHPVRFVVDTGASFTTLSAEDAAEAGIDTRGAPRTAVMTANGMSEVARVRLPSLELGSIRMTGVDALVTDEGALHTSLLGMNVLDQLSGWRVSGDRLVLEP